MNSSFSVADISSKGAIFGITYKTLGKNANRRPKNSKRVLMERKSKAHTKVNLSTRQTEVYEVCGSIFRILVYHGTTERVSFSEISTVKTHFGTSW